MYLLKLLLNAQIRSIFNGLLDLILRVVKMALFQNITINIFLILPVILMLIYSTINKSSKYLQDGLVLASVFAISILHRLPYVLMNAPLSHDEDILLTFGINLKFNHMIFDTIEPTTQGIIHAYVPMFIELSSQIHKYAYSSLHLLSVLIHVICIFVMYKAIKNMFSFESAIFATYLGMLFFIFNKLQDFIHYHNEIESILLLALTIYLSSLISMRSDRYKMAVCTNGLLLGMTPYSKLQAIPIAIVFFTWCIYLICKNYINKITILTMYTTCCLLPTIILLILLNTRNLLDDFIFYYVKSNMYYHNNTSLPDNILSMLSSTPINVACSMFIAACLIIYSFNKLSNKQFNYLLIAILTSSLYSIARTGHSFPHYFSYLFIFVTLAGSYCFSTFKTDKQKLTCTIVVNLTCILLSLNSFEHRKERLTGDYFSPIRQSAASKAILGLSLTSGESLVVWGWYPILNIETGLPSGTKENHSYYSSHSLLKNDFENRYVKDMIKNQPLFFVDSKVMMLDEYVPFESKKEISKYINDNYVFYRTLSGSDYYDNNMVDIYINKNRIAK